MHFCFSASFDCEAKLLNIPQLFDNFGPTGCEIVECFSTFDNLGLIGNQIVGSTSPIRQFGLADGAFLLKSGRQSHPVTTFSLFVNPIKLMTLQLKPFFSIKKKQASGISCMLAFVCAATS